LLDEAVTAKLADQLKANQNLNVRDIKDLQLSGYSDEEVVAFAKSDNRIVITVETGLNERSFPICTHPGIIVIGGKSRHEDIQAECFKKFMLSGHRVEAKDSVTYINSAEMKIKKHNGSSTYKL
jgi:predicted nuclease of predicted toxin-antitoxin system